MRVFFAAALCAVGLWANASAQTPPVDPALDLSRVPPQALARMMPDLRAAEASSKNFLPAEAGPFSANGPIAAGAPIASIPRRYAHTAILDAPLTGPNGAVWLEAGAPVFRWHIPASDASQVVAFWCGVKDAHAYCFTDASAYEATGPVPFEPAGVTHPRAFNADKPAPALHEVDFAQSGLPTIEWFQFFEGWEPTKLRVSTGWRIGDTMYGRHETYYQRRDPQQTPMSLQNDGRLIARPGPDASSAIIEVVTPVGPYTPNELEVWTRAVVTFLGRP